MSDLIDEFVNELIETGSTGSKDDPDFIPPMDKRTPGKWSYKYDSERDCHVFCVDSDKALCDSVGNMQLMSHSPEMYRLLWVFAKRSIYYRKVFIHMLAKIYVEPDPDLNIPEELISQVKELRKELNKHVQ